MTNEHLRCLTALSSGQVNLALFGFDSTNELKVSLYGKKTVAGDQALLTDTNGFLQSNWGTLLAGENQTTNRMETSPRYTYKNVTASGSTVVDGASGLLHTVTINTKSGANGILVLYDNATVASGTKIATIDVTGGPLTLTYDVTLTAGLVASFTGTLGSMDLTISYL